MIDRLVIRRPVASGTPGIQDAALARKRRALMANDNSAAIRECL